MTLWDDCCGMLLSGSQIDNVWRHWFACHLAAVGGRMRLPLEPLSEATLALLNGLNGHAAPGAEPAVEPELPPAESDGNGLDVMGQAFNRAARRKVAHAERAAEKPHPQA